MLYTVKFTKKKKLFQSSFTIEDDNIYITDTVRAKKKFLKSGIRNVVFTSDVSEDALFAELVKPVYGYDRAFLLNYLEDLTRQLTEILKISLPVDTLAVSSPDAAEIACRFAKTVIIVGEGEDEVIDGVNVLYLKRLKRMPDMAIVLEKGVLPPLVGVPIVDLSESAKSSHLCASWETMSFKCDLLPYEISAKSLMYLMKTVGDFSYKVTGYRKKLPALFTFL